MKDHKEFLVSYLIGVVFTTLYFTFDNHPSGLVFCAGSILGALLLLACRRYCRRRYATKVML